MSKWAIMMVPRFSIRRALLAMVMAGLFFATAALAVQGRLWAIAITAALLSLLLVFAIHAISYLCATLIAACLPKRQSRDERRGPFATTRMPPQLIPPKAPSND